MLFDAAHSERTLVHIYMAPSRPPFIYLHLLTPRTNLPPTSYRSAVEGVFHHARRIIATNLPTALASTSLVAAEDVNGTARIDAVAVAGIKKDAAVLDGPPVAVPVCVPLW
jgi:hypothetical protein